MNALKKVTTIAGILTAVGLSAQTSQMTNMLKVGVNGGFALPKDNASGAAGIDVAYQNLSIRGFGIGIASGYTQYFGRTHDGVNNNDFGVVPAAALFRYYPMQTGFYIGSDIGYGFITGNKRVAAVNADQPLDVERPDGGFYINPEIGYHNENWNFGVHYQKVFTGDKGQVGGEKYSAGNLGLSVSYNIPLGK